MAHQLLSRRDHGLGRRCLAITWASRGPADISDLDLEVRPCPPFAWLRLCCGCGMIVLTSEARWSERIVGQSAVGTCAVGWCVSCSQDTLRDEGHALSPADRTVAVLLGG